MMDMDDLRLCIACSFDGIVVGRIRLDMTKGGTLPRLTMTVAFQEYDGSTSICRVSHFGPYAEKLANTLKPGDAVHVEGNITLNTWEKDGEQRSGLAVTALRVVPLGQVPTLVAG